MEYIASSEAVKEIKFVYQLLISMEIKVTLPIIVWVDNLEPSLCQKMLLRVDEPVMWIFAIITSESSLKKVFEGSVCEDQRKYCQWFYQEHQQ